MDLNGAMTGSTQTSRTFNDRTKKSSHTNIFAAHAKQTYKQKYFVFWMLQAGIA